MVFKGALSKQMGENGVLIIWNKKICELMSDGKSPAQLICQLSMIMLQKDSTQIIKKQSTGQTELNDNLVLIPQKVSAGYLSGLNHTLNIALTIRTHQREGQTSDSVSKEDLNCKFTGLKPAHLVQDVYHI